MTKLTATAIPPKYVYTQATEPTDRTEGKIWYNIINKQAYISDGITYNILSTDLSNVEKMIAQNSLNVIDNTAQASLTAGTNANFIRDVYSVSGGYLSSIDVANTTGGFGINSYINGVSSDNVGFIGTLDRKSVV